MPTADLKRLMKKLNEQSNKILLKHEKELLSHYKNALNSIRTDIVKLYEKLGDKPDYLLASSRLKNLETEIVKKINIMTGKVGETIKSGLDDILEFNYQKTSKAITTAIGFGTVNERSISASIINQYNWEGRQLRYSNKLIDEIKREITQGLITGRSVQNTTKAITERFNISANNASRIIRTESHKAESAARQLSIEENKLIAEQNGFKLLKVWSSATTARESHLEMNGQVADENGLFYFNDGGSTEAPGLSGIAEEDINCRCAVYIELVKI